MITITPSKRNDVLCRVGDKWYTTTILFKANSQWYTETIVTGMIGSIVRYMYNLVNSSSVTAYLIDIQE